MTVAYAHQPMLSLWGDVVIPDTPADAMPGGIWNKVDLGPLDGPSGQYARTRPNPALFGLDVDTDLAGYAARLFDTDQPLSARHRVLLHRAAVLSTLGSADRREKLRVAAQWFAVVRDTANARWSAPMPTDVEREISFAIHAALENGAAQLAIAEAKKWMNPGSQTDYSELIQIAVDATVSGLHRYDHTKGHVSTYLKPRVREAVAEHVRRTDFPGMPRSAFKVKGLIKETAKRLKAEAALDGERITPDALVEAVFVEVDAATRTDPNKPSKVTRNGIVQVLFGTPQQSLNATRDHDDESGGREFGDTVADDAIAVNPEDQFSYSETLAQIATAIDGRLDDDERSMLLRHFGLDDQGGATLREIGEDHDRSRAWVGVRVQRALAKLQHPLVVGDLIGCEADPSLLSDEVLETVSPTGTWLDGLTERQRYVAGNFFGYGQQPLAGTPQQRVATIAKLLDVAEWVVTRLAAQVEAARTNAPIPALYPDWYLALSERHQAAVRIVFGFGARATTDSLDARIGRLADELGVGHATAQALARVAAGKLPATSRNDADVIAITRTVTTATRQAA